MGTENKVRVTKLLFTDATIGLMDPKVDMEVYRGIEKRWIVGLDSGNIQVTLATESGGTVVSKAYPHELVVQTGVANYFGWPSGGGSVAFGRTGATDTAVGSGMAYATGQSVKSFNR